MFFLFVSICFYLFETFFMFLTFLVVPNIPCCSERFLCSERSLLCRTFLHNSANVNHFALKDTTSF